MGNGAIKADWGQPGEDLEREREHPSSALKPSSAAQHRHTQLQISFTGEGATPLNFKASLERGLFSYQGDWRYFGSKTL